MLDSYTFRPIKREAFEGCRVCSNHPSKIEQIHGFYIENGFAIECSCHKQWRADQTIYVRAESSGVRPLDINYNPLKEYRGEASTLDVSKLIHFATHFQDNKNTHIYMWGPHKAQKTTLGNWLGSALIRQGFTVQLILMNNLINDIQTNFEDKQKAEDSIKKYMKADCLILDESFDPHKVTLYKSGYQFPFLDAFLRERMEDKRKSTVFISNVPPTSIEKNYNSSISSLVLRNTVDVGTVLHFRDIYDVVTNKFENVENIFKRKGSL